ncbi:MAG: universal stress protein [Methanosarcinaceae archaeon]|nr:universal stress protein [Methanosarcinaceae archaeon]
MRCIISGYTEVKEMTTFQLLIDGSESSEVAAEYALKLASVCDAKIVPTNVIDIRRFRTPRSIETMKKVVEDFTKNLNITAMNQNVTIAPARTITANPIKDILAETKAIGADLIITGAAGYTREKINDVASEILKRAPCNVVLARGSQGSNGTRNKIIIPTRDNESAAGHAASLAKRFGADLVACNTLENTDVLPSRVVYLSEAASNTGHVLGERVTVSGTMAAKQKQAYINRAHKDADAFVDIAKQKGVHTKSVVLEGNPLDAIPSYAAKENFDLMVLQYQNKGRFSRLLSSNISEKLAHTAPCSVYVVKNGC